MSILKSLNFCWAWWLKKRGAGTAIPAGAAPGGNLVHRPCGCHRTARTPKPLRLEASTETERLGSPEALADRVSPQPFEDYEHGDR